jgi:hypothetical protein
MSPKLETFLRPDVVHALCVAAALWFGFATQEPAAATEAHAEVSATLEAAPTPAEAPAVVVEDTRHEDAPGEDTRPVTDTSHETTPEHAGLDT